MRSVLIGFVCLAIFLFSSISCKGGEKPERDIRRTISAMLKEMGQSESGNPQQYVAENSQPEISSWSRSLFFPDVSSPLTGEDESKLNRFIGLFYKITIDEIEETSAIAHLTWAATDALIGFPSISDNSMVPGSALYYVTLERESTGEEEYSDWKIVTFGPQPIN